METDSQAEPASPPSGTELDLPPPVALDSSTEEPQNQTYEASTSSSVQALGEGEEEAPIPTTADASEGEPTTTTRRSRRISQSNAAGVWGS